MSCLEMMFLPAGFRFHPTDEELVLHYLIRRCAGQPISAPIIAELDLYKYDPWQLPGMALYGEKEWYFFSPRDRKYPNGSRPNRAAGTGYWKATGADKPIGSPKTLAIKKALVFYSGKAPHGEKTNWIMHEYRLAGVDRSARKKNNLRLDDWVLCRLYNKKGASEIGMSLDGKSIRNKAARLIEPKIESPPHVPQHDMHVRHSPRTEMWCFSSSSVDSPSQMHGDSSCGSEHVLSPTITCDLEAESRLRWREWGNAFDFPINNEIAIDAPLTPFSPGSLLDEYIWKPF